MSLWRQHGIGSGLCEGMTGSHLLGKAIRVGLDP